jgi:uncharacterized protein CbrC (UPF0167 family)
MGPVYAAEELANALCPWCIADGSAAARFDADFTDRDGVGGFGEWSQVAPEVVEEVSRRTPGFSGWQQERWWTHCGDAAKFLGRAGRIELVAQWSGAVPALRTESGMTITSGRPSSRSSMQKEALVLTYSSAVDAVH